MFDFSSTSTYQIASSSYTWLHTCSGNNRYLLVGISILSVLGSSVSNITYNGVSLSLIRARSSVAGAIRVEQWGLKNPSFGSNSIVVTLSTALASVANAVSFKNVNQLTPIRTSNDNTDTNVGAADATLTLEAQVGELLVDTVATNDTSITASDGQTEQLNESGALGSSGISTKIGSNCSWTDIGGLMTWTLVGSILVPTDTILNQSLRVRRRLLKVR